MEGRERDELTNQNPTSVKTVFFRSEREPGVWGGERKWRDSVTRNCPQIGGEKVSQTEALALREVRNRSML